MPTEAPPVMPSHWKAPFSVFGWNASYAITNNDEEHTAIIDDLTKEEAMFLVELLNWQAKWRKQDEYPGVENRESSLALTSRQHGPNDYGGGYGN